MTRKTTDGYYLGYVPLVALNEVSQMLPNHEKFLVRVVQMWCIAKEDPLGIVQEVQPKGSYFWGCVADAPYHEKFLVRVAQMWQ